MRLIVRLLGVLFLAMMLVTALNFFSDNRPTEAQARALACANGGPKCVAVMTRHARTPLWQDITFRASGKTVEIRCMRSALFFGDNRCERR